MTDIGLRAVSTVGAFALLACAFGMGRRRGKVARKTVIWGVSLQWAVGWVLLQLPGGQHVLNAVSQAVATVLAQSYEGSRFVFGALGMEGGGSSNLGVIFAFQVLPAIVFVASLFAVLYHLGVMQVIVRVLAMMMMRTMGTSGAEALNVAASIFMGQTEAPLTIRPFLAKLTESELFLVMVSGMASVSGAILAAYVVIGQVPIAFLLTAVAMTAPISIVMAKLLVPEVSVPVTAGSLNMHVERTDTNVLDAAATGASEGLRLAANVAAMLIAFIAMVALLNAMLGFIDIGGAPLSVQRVFGWLCMPIALLMGVPLGEATDVGTVLGTRTVVNEIVAFEALRTVAPALSARSVAIATVAVCGFANVSSIGILIGGLGAIVPGRKHDIARLGVRALLAATLANFSSACVMGALYRGTS